ncbi:MAG: tetratricopeptide repeat protein [Flavobacteriaceae bacterium]
MKQLLLFLFLCSNLLLSQTKVDSLQQAYEKTSVDTLRVKILNQLGIQQAKESPEDARRSFLKAIELATRANNEALQIKSYHHYASFLNTQSMEDSAIAVYHKSRDLAKRINFPKGESDALVGLAASYWRKANFEKANEYARENIALATRMEDKVSVANSYMIQGNIYTQQNDYTKAMEHYTLGAGVYKEVGELERYITALGNIGFVHRNLENYEKAIDYLQESDSIARILNLPRARAFSAYNLSIIYRKTGELDRAIASNTQAIEMYEKLGDRKRIAFGKLTMGKIYWEKGAYQKTLDYYKEALEISKQVDDSVNIGHTYNDIAKCYQHLGDNDKAKEYLLLAGAVANGIELDILAMNVHQNLSQIYAEERNFEKAHENLAKYAILRDTLYTKEKRDLGTEIEAKYQNEQKTQEIALLESEKELQDLQLTKRVNERNGIIAFSVIMLLLASLLYNQFRIKKKANQKLQELDRMKSNFFANISHEFRTPLTLIKGPIDRLEQNPEERLSIENIKMIRRNSGRVLKLVNQLLDLSKIDEGNLKLVLTEGDVYKCLRAATSSFNSHAAQRQFDYRVQIPQAVLWASFDRDKLEKVVYNLLGNAFKFSDDSSKVLFEADYNGQDLKILVADSGKGIPKEELPFIFDRFYQADSGPTRDREGSGIGLSLSKDLVELMDGTITVSSEEGQGSFFTVQLPIQEIKTGVAHDQEQKRSRDNFYPKTTPFTLEKEDMRMLPSILLIEDNADMRHFIKESLIERYRVAEATDGSAGFLKAKGDHPDLIITDLMMPKMDGLELCKKLKSDVDTSHIPVIMLTAKAGMENKLEGLETGADDYLTKPFDANELLVRTKNLIEQRKKLRELFSNKEVQIDPKKITVSSVDQRFVEDLLKVLEQHYSNGEFGVPQLQEALAMSKSQLHRKLKALTNQGPGELLRNFRLKRAAQLLMQKADTVTQIAYKVGFNDLSYFTKCFKELYGVVPSAYPETRLQDL